MPRNLRIDTSGDTPELYIYDEIGPAWYGLIDAQAVLDALQGLGAASDLVVRINSPGGDVFAGIAIYNALVRHAARIRIEIDGLAASIASVIAMAGDEIVIAGNATLMIHRAWTVAWGNAEELGRVIESLQVIDDNIVATYDARTNDMASRDEIVAWLEAETWMGPYEAVARGFADRVGELQEGIAMHVPEGRYKNTPQRLLVPAATSAASPPDPPIGRTIAQYAARIASVRQRDL